jgi:hypothetical protein
MRKGDIKVLKPHRSFVAWSDLIDKVIKSTSWFMNHRKKKKMSWLTKEEFMFKFYKGNWKALYDQISTTETMHSNFLQCELCVLSLKELSHL